MDQILEIHCRSHDIVPGLVFVRQSQLRVPCHHVAPSEVIELGQPLEDDRIALGLGVDDISDLLDGHGRFGRSFLDGVGVDGCDVAVCEIPARAEQGVCFHFLHGGFGNGVLQDLLGAEDAGSRTRVDGRMGGGVQGTQGAGRGRWIFENAVLV